MREIKGEYIPDEAREEERDIVLIKKEKHISRRKEAKGETLCIQITESFCSDITDSFQDFFKSGTDISPENLPNREETSPFFYIALGDERKEILKVLGLTKHLKKDSLLLVFDLPEILISPPSKEYVTAYKELKRKVWEIKDYYKQEEGLKLRRLNPINKHEAGKYHYIWEALLK